VSNFACGIPSKPIRCPGDIGPDGVEVSCDVVTAIPDMREKRMVMTEDAAGFVPHGYRCKAHPRPSWVAPRRYVPEVRPQRPLPSPVEQAAARAAMARSQWRAEVQKETDRRDSAAQAIKMHGAAVLSRTDLHPRDREILNELVNPVREGNAWLEVA
jgi:hypothetical protein